MTSFRLARLLRLRENQERVAREAWAAAQRETLRAAAARVAARETLERASDEIASAHDGSDARSGASMQGTLAAYGALDHLRERSQDAVAAETEAAQHADEVRVPYDERRREVEALKRLETRWKEAERKARLRREYRATEAFLVARDHRTHRTE